MSFKGSSKWKAASFDAERIARERAVDLTALSLAPLFVKRDDGWILFGPQDVRNSKLKYNFALQCLTCDNQIRVRVGCRFKTLPQAWAHWGVHRGKNRGSVRRNECGQAIAIIRLMLLQAQAYGLLPRYAPPIKFDSTILKPKRK